MRALVTGAAGFIGSTLSDRLLADGHDVVGVDCFTPYYDPAAKRRNLSTALAASGFELIEADLRVVDLRALLDGVDVVFHQAAQPGVRLSWSTEFAQYAEQNILVTQRLLEAAREVAVGRIVYASSSSVYGNAARFPTTEGDLPQPHSPYGVTKLAAEHLCGLYAENYDLPTVSLRYFTVYGPRQRPDMAMHRLIESGLTGTPFRLYGSGEQIRDFTFVEDAVAANLAAATADIKPGTICNVAGGGSISMNALIALLNELGSFEIPVETAPTQAGDVQQTGGDVRLAFDFLGWQPQTGLREGLEAQIGWHREVSR